MKRTTEMKNYQEKQKERFRVVAIIVAYVHILCSSVVLIMGIEKRSSSFAFRAIPLNGKTAGPEAEVNITVPSKCLVDVLTVVMAIILLSSFIRRKMYPVLIWIIYQAFKIAWDVTFTWFYPPPTSITIRLVLWFFSIVTYIFVCINVGEMWAIKLAGQPSSPKQLLQEDAAPTYKDVGPSCVDMELEVASRQDEPPPPYLNSCNCPFCGNK